MQGQQGADGHSHRFSLALRKRAIVEKRGHMAASTALKRGRIALLSWRLLEFWGYGAGHEGP